MAYTRSSEKINFLYDYSQLYELISTLITRKLRTIDDSLVDDFGLSDVDKSIYNSLAENTVKTILLLMMKMTYGISDDIVLEFPDQTNLILNHSFEVHRSSGLNQSDFDYWIEYGQAAPNYVQACSSLLYVHEGDYSCKINRGASGSPSITQYIDIKEGANYKLSYWSRDNSLLQIRCSTGISVLNQGSDLGNSLTKIEVEFKCTEVVDPYIKLLTYGSPVLVKEATFDYIILTQDTIIFRINDKTGFNDNYLPPVDNNLKEYLKHDILRQWFQIYNLSELVKAEEVYIKTLEFSMFKNFIELRKPLIS